MKPLQFNFLNMHCRGLDNDVQLKDLQVSRKQCVLEVHGQIVRATNLSEVNPTRINGDDLEGTTVLLHRDLLTFGDRSARFEYTIKVVSVP